MSSYFPILNSPRDVAEQRLKRLSIGELLEMAQLSKKSFALVQDIITIYKEKAYLVVQVDSPTLLRVRCRNEHCDFHFYGKRDSRRYDLEDLEQRTLRIENDSAGVVTELVIYEQSREVYGCSSGSIQDVFLLIQYFSSLFNASVDSLTINAANFHHMKAIQSIELLKESKNVFIQEGRVSHDEMRQILGGFEPKKLEISCTTERDFSYDHIISIHNFSADHDGWFNGSMLLNLRSKVISVKSDDVTDEDMNTFLHEWMKGTAGCAKRFFMEICRETSNWDMDTVTKGLSNLHRPVYQMSHNNTRSFWRRIDQMIISIQLIIENSRFHLIIREDYYL